jgi:hypothetical protein
MKTVSFSGNLLKDIKIGFGLLNLVQQVSLIDAKRLQNPIFA